MIVRISTRIVIGIVSSHEFLAHIVTLGKADSPSWSCAKLVEVITPDSKKSFTRSSTKYPRPLAHTKNTIIHKRFCHFLCWSAASRAWERPWIDVGGISVMSLSCPFRGFSSSLWTPVSKLPNA